EGTINARREREKTKKQKVRREMQERDSKTAMREIVEGIATRIKGDNKQET
ncbi:1914_t:CDS:1, partial [Racocetra fulgida]